MLPPRSDLAGNPLLGQHEQTAHPLCMDGQPGLRICWLRRLNQLGFGKLPVAAAAAVRAQTFALRSIRSGTTSASISATCLGVGSRSFGMPSTSRNQPACFCSVKCAVASCSNVGRHAGWAASSAGDHPESCVNRAMQSSMALLSACHPLYFGSGLGGGGAFGAGRCALSRCG